MKKAKHFCLAFVPVIFAIIIQNLAVFFAMGVSALIEGTWYLSIKSLDFYTILDDLSILWAANSFNTHVLIIYAAMTLVIFGLWYYMCYEGNYLPNIRCTFHPLTILGIIMLVPGMQYLSTYIVSFIAVLFPSWVENYIDLIESAGLDNMLTVSMFLYSVILAPLSEELIFRGVTMRQARRALPFWGANLMQAFLFGAFHMNMVQGIYAFCLGLILGYLCERGGSIYHSILLHMLFNLWAAVVSEHITMGDTVFAFIFWFVFAGVMTSGGLLLFAAGRRRCSASNA